MAKNINKTDRFIRIILGLLLMWLIFLTSEDPLLSMLFGLIGLYLFITAAVGNCPFYRFFGLSTSKKKTRMH